MAARYSACPWPFDIPQLVASKRIKLTWRDEVSTHAKTSLLSFALWFGLNLLFHQEVVSQAMPARETDPTAPHIDGILDYSPFRVVGHFGEESSSSTRRQWADPWHYDYDGNDPQFMGRTFVYLGADSFSNQGMAVFEVTDLTNPTLVSFYAPAGEGGLHLRDAEVHDGVGFFSSNNGGGVHVVDLRANPVDPPLLRRLNSAEGGINRVHRISVENNAGGRFLYEAGRSQGVAVFDVTDARNPETIKQVGLWGVNLDFHDTLGTGGRVYIADLTTNGGRTLIYDTKNIANNPRDSQPPLLADFSSGAGTHSMVPSDDGNFIYVGHERGTRDLRVYDITDLNSPILLHSFSNEDMLGGAISNVHNVAPPPLGDYLFHGWAEMGLTMHDISDPANPKYLGSFDTHAFHNTANEEGAWGAYHLMGLDRVLVPDRDSGLWIVDVTNGARPIDRVELDGSVLTSVTVDGTTIPASQLVTGMSTGNPSSGMIADADDLHLGSWSEDAGEWNINLGSFKDTNGPSTPDFFVFDVGGDQPLWVTPVLPDDTMGTPVQFLSASGAWGPTGHQVGPAGALEEVRGLAFSLRDLKDQAGVNLTMGTEIKGVRIISNRRIDPRDILGTQGGEFSLVDPVLFAAHVVPSAALQAGDADQDLDFDQLDLVRVQFAGKYLTGQSATWGEGDWDGAPGGSPGSPPAGNGFFDQLDILAALGPAHYLNGPYAALAGEGTQGDGQTSIGYNPSTGEIFVDAPAGQELTSINIDSAGGIFTGGPAQNLGGSFDNDADSNIFKATFGGSFGSLMLGNVAQTGLSQDFVLNDLTVVGSLAGGGALGDVDLIYVPEPTTVLLLAIGFAVGLIHVRRIKGRN